MRAAQRDDAECEPATALLHLALWPGLDAAHGRLQRYFRDAPELLVSELSGRLVDQVAQLDTGRVNRIAATIVRNIERDTTRALIAGSQESRRLLEPGAADAAERRSSGSPLGLPRDVPTDRASEIIADRLTPVIGRDADLVVDVAVNGYTLKEAAARHDLTHDAARKRYYRALGRLREVYEDFF